MMRRCMSAVHGSLFVVSVTKRLLSDDENATRFHGVIVKWVESKGYGFVQCKQNRVNYFCHNKSFAADHRYRFNTMGERQRGYNVSFQLKDFGRGAECCETMWEEPPHQPDGPREDLVGVVTGPVMSKAYCFVRCSSDKQTYFCARNAFLDVAEEWWANEGLRVKFNLAVRVEGHSMQCGNVQLVDPPAPLEEGTRRGVIVSFHSSRKSSLLRDSASNRHLRFLSAAGRRWSSGQLVEYCLRYDASRGAIVHSVRAHSFEKDVDVLDMPAV